MSNLQFKQFTKQFKYLHYAKFKHWKEKLSKKKFGPWKKDKKNPKSNQSGPAGLENKKNVEVWKMNFHFCLNKINLWWKKTCFQNILDSLPHNTMLKRHIFFTFRAASGFKIVGGGGDISARSTKTKIFTPPYINLTSLFCKKFYLLQTTNFTFKYRVGKCLINIFIYLKQWNIQWNP